MTSPLVNDASYLKAQGIIKSIHGGQNLVKFIALIKHFLISQELTNQEQSRLESVQDSKGLKVTSCQSWRFNKKFCCMASVEPDQCGAGSSPGRF